MGVGKGKPPMMVAADNRQRCRGRSRERVALLGAVHRGEDHP